MHFVLNLIFNVLCLFIYMYSNVNINIDNNNNNNSNNNNVISIYSKVIYSNLIYGMILDIIYIIFNRNKLYKNN